MKHTQCRSVKSSALLQQITAVILYNLVERLQALAHCLKSQLLCMHKLHSNTHTLYDQSRSGYTQAVI